MEKKIYEEIVETLTVRANLTSQTSVANETGISRPYINELISGKADVAGLTLRALFQLFPLCEIKLNYHIDGQQDFNKLAAQLHAYIDTLTPPQQKKAFELLKIAFTDNDKPTK